MSRGLSHPTVATKLEVIDRDGGLCMLALHDCQGDAATTDHRANRGAGGSRVLNDGTNLIAACAVCNGHKADARGRTRDFLIERGLLVTPAATHAKTLLKVQFTPVQDVAGDWWTLLSERDRCPATAAEISAHLTEVRWTP